MSNKQNDILDESKKEAEDEKNKKYNDDSKYFKDWTTKKLKQEAKSYDQLIYEIECYGTSDINALLCILQELENRGIKCQTATKITFI